MGLLDRLRAWWRAAIGTSSGEPGEPKPTGAFECAVCGTGVDDPEGPCPLCQSTDIVPSGEPAESAADRPAATERRVADDADSVEKLRELRADGEVLERHADCWRPVDGGFAVETPDDERVVDSRAAVIDLLRRHYE
jgi:hypothetical protein